jgi:hypothetical protein
MGIEVVGSSTRRFPPPGGVQLTCLPGGTGEVGGDDVSRVPVQAAAGPLWRIVVRGSACEAASWTSRSGTRASRAAVMKACRSVWGVTVLAIPARRAIWRTTRPNIRGRAFGRLKRYRRSDCPVRCGGSEVCTALALSSARTSRRRSAPCTRYACRTRGPAVDRRCSGGGVRVRPGELDRRRQRRSWCLGPAGAPRVK